MMKKTKLIRGGIMALFVLAALLLLTCVVGAGFENIPWLNNLLNQAVRIIGG